MENKSKLPIPSGQKPTGLISKVVFDKYPTNKTTSQVPLSGFALRGLKRRSKSTTDLSTISGNIKFADFRKLRDQPLTTTVKMPTTENNKSKLPKTGLKAPMITAKAQNDKSPTTSATSRAAMFTSSSLFSSRLKRRSKSVTDLSSFVEKMKVSDLNKIPERPPATTTKKPLRQINTTVNSSTTTTQRNAVKRPGTKTDDDVKPKVARQQKIPDWDYKTRFNVLNEKHKALVENYNAMKAKLSDFEEIDVKYMQLQIEKRKADQHIDHLSQENKILKERNITLESENIDLTKNLKYITREYEDLQKLHEALCIKDKENEKQIKSLKVSENRLNVLLKEHDDLVNTFNNISADHKSVSQQLSTITEELGMENQKTASLEEENVVLKQTLHDQEILRRSLHNTIQDLKGKIRVFCRVRPPIDGEDTYSLCSFNYIDETGLEIQKSKNISKAVDAKGDFTFDRVFSTNCTQKEVFEDLALLVQSALDGYNVCVFAYGQTGSGKTYTMQGLDTTDELGLIPRTIDLIFHRIDQLRNSNWLYEVSASFLEIYNENLHDLLNVNSSDKLDIYFNEGKGTTVTNLTITKIESAEHLKSLMKSALENRKVAATNFNEQSSRSHAISTIYLTGTDTIGRQSYTSTLNLVDLAGSENAKYSTDNRLVETKHINKSLSALGNVMLALHNKRKHIPYRDSKLTYLLQPSLGGNSKTLMIVNISPFDQNYSESINTLRFASKVKEVSSVSKKNKTQLVMSPLRTDQ